MKHRCEMKAFIKMVAASMLGFLLAGAFLSFLVLLGLGGLYLKENMEVLSMETDKRPILEVELDSEIVERVDKYSLNLYEEIPYLQKFQKIGLLTLQQTIEKAITDNNIKILYLKFGKLEGGWATLSALYETLMKF